MWEPLQGPLASPSDNVKTQTLWVIGTALQNNPAAQKAVRAFFSRNTPTLTLPLAWDASESQCLALDPLPTVLSCLSPSVRSSKQLRSKAIYALSGLLKHNTAAIASFETAGGWDALRGTLSGTITPARSSVLPHNLNLPISRLRRLGHQRPAQDRISPQQPPHTVRRHDSSRRTPRRENT